MQKAGEAFKPMRNGDHTHFLIHAKKRRDFYLRDYLHLQIERGEREERALVTFVAEPFANEEEEN